MYSPRLWSWTFLAANFEDNRLMWGVSYFPGTFSIILKPEINANISPRFRALPKPKIVMNSYVLQCIPIETSLPPILSAPLCTLLTHSYTPHHSKLRSREINVYRSRRTTISFLQSYFVLKIKKGMQSVLKAIPEIVFSVCKECLFALAHYN